MFFLDFNLNSDKRESKFSHGVKLDMLNANDLPENISNNMKKYKEWLA